MEPKLINPIMLKCKVCKFSVVLKCHQNWNIISIKKNYSITYITYAYSIIASTFYTKMLCLYLKVCNFHCSSHPVTCHHHHMPSMPWMNLSLMSSFPGKDVQMNTNKEASEIVLVIWLPSFKYKCFKNFKRITFFIVWSKNFAFKYLR